MICINWRELKLLVALFLVLGGGSSIPGVIVAKAVKYDYFAMICSDGQIIKSGAGGRVM